MAQPHFCSRKISMNSNEKKPKTKNQCSHREKRNTRNRHSFCDSPNSPSYDCWQESAAKEEGVSERRSIPGVPESPGQASFQEGSYSRDTHAAFVCTG